MKNVATRYPVNGTSALDLRKVRMHTSASIIPFPGNPNFSSCRPTVRGEFLRLFEDSGFESDQEHFSQLDGRSAAFLGSLFTLVSTVIVLIGLL